ncbi:unnamed protein product [Durusdinium trenchii]|uniref:Tex-like protein N-terminal domain-containing protein n=1 Tax=Durusdinium trenchii TaxID=1381693 RepID=A0ABP0R3W7_9DINO
MALASGRREWEGHAGIGHVRAQRDREALQVASALIAKAARKGARSARPPTRALQDGLSKPKLLDDGCHVMDAAEALPEHQDASCDTGTSCDSTATTGESEEIDVQSWRAVGCKVLQVLEERDKLDELEVVPMDEPAASGLLGATHSQLTQESPALATMLPSGLDERWAQEMQIPLEHLKEAIRLLQEGYAMPFIAQYRKDAIGLLSLEQLNRLQRRLEQHQALERKRQEVALAWSEIGCEPPADIQASLLQCTSLEDLEELQCSAKRCHAAGSALTLEQLDQLLARAEEIPDCEGGQDFEKLPVDFVEETMPSQDMEIPRKAEEDDAEKNPEGLISWPHDSGR